MMEWGQTILLAVVQGLTEFLPISSSAHLILMPYLFGWRDQGLAFDVAVHVGSLAAVLAYFRHQLVELWHGWWRHVTGYGESEASRLAWAVLLTTIPVTAVGGLFYAWIEAHLRDPLVIATTTLGFALLLGWADRSGSRTRTEADITWRDIIIVGCAQALALVPGTSRAGITITAGLWVGLRRRAAARFSFLLSIPAIALAGSRKTWDLIVAPGPVPWVLVLAGAAISGVTAFLCIHWFLRLVERIGLSPFVVYRLVLAVVLFWIYL